MSQSKSRQLRRKQKKETTKLLCKLKDIVCKVHTERKWKKMFICVNSENQRDILVIPYMGNEKLLGALGNDTVLNIGDIERKNNLVLLGEYDKDTVLITDGQSVYKIKV